MKKIIEFFTKPIEKRILKFQNSIFKASTFFSIIIIILILIIYFYKK